MHTQHTHTCKGASACTQLCLVIKEACACEQEFGPIESASVLKAPDGSLRGVGFVQFIKPEDAARALAALHNKQARVMLQIQLPLVNCCRCACAFTSLHCGGKGAASHTEFVIIYLCGTFCKSVRMSA